MRQALKITWKELVSYIREERFWMLLLMPIVIMPLLMYAPSLFLGWLDQQGKTRVLRVAVQGVPPEVVATLQENRLMPLETDDPRRAVQRREAEVGLVFAQGRFTVYDKTSPINLQDSAAAQRVKDTLQRHKDKLVEQRLRAGGLDWADLEPFGLETKKAASEQEQALGLLALLIPMLIFNMVMAGGQSVALDATAGEKQMGTLEALLVAPLEPWKLLLGKGLAVFVTALFSSFASVVGLALGSFMVYSGFSPQIRALSAEHVPIGTFALPASSLTLILLTAVLFSAFLVGVVLSLGIFARSYREANTYLIPLELLAFLPMLIFFLSEHLQPQIWHFALPGVGVVFALDGIVKGSAEPGQLALTWLCTLVYTLAALGWAYWSLRREDVIFRN